MTYELRTFSETDLRSASDGNRPSRAALGFLNPLIAGALMAFSAAYVASNSLRLRRFQPWPTT